MDVSRSGTSTAVAAEPGRHCQSGASIVTVKVGTIMIAAGPAAVPHGARRRRGDCRRCFAAWQGLLGSESLPMPYAVCGE